MWENSSKNEEKYNSIQNILKNFDPFEVLEPLTPEGIPKENILVDLTDNKVVNNGPNDIELSGSLLDKSTKSDFDDIDVFQNLFVTPHHVIKSKKHKDKNLQENKDWIRAFDGIDHKNDEEIDMKKELESIFTVNTQRIPNVTLTRLSDDEVDVDEIDEVLTIKRMQMLRSPVQNYTINVDLHCNTLHNNTVKTRDQSIDYIVQRNDIQPIPSTSLNMAKQELINRTNLIKNDDYIAINKSKLNEIYNPTKFSNLQMVKTIKLDKKKLQKKRVLPDDEKRYYTKGPDLVEKSISLPSIIERLKARQKLIDNEKCLRRRFVLEPDNIGPYVKPNNTHIITNESTSYNFNPIVLNADCNKERLKTLQVGRAFEKFVVGTE